MHDSLKFCVHCFGNLMMLWLWGYLKTSKELKSPSVKIIFAWIMLIMGFGVQDIFFGCRDTRFVLPLVELHTSWRELHSAGTIIMGAAFILCSHLFSSHEYRYCILLKFYDRVYLLLWITRGTQVAQCIKLCISHAFLSLV